jgi:PKD repeat protein
MKKTSTLSCFLVGFMVLLSTNLEAKVVHVANWGNDLSGDGTSGYPYSSIQHAINISNPGDTVKVADGNYNGPIVINKNMALVSSGGPEFCTIKGDGSNNVVKIDSCTALLRGFRLETGYSLVEINGAFATVEHCIFDARYSGYEKGITANTASGLIQRNIFINTMDWAISVNSGDIDIVNNTIYQNQMTGIYLADGVSSDVVNNIIAYNNQGIVLNGFGFAGTITFNDLWQNATDISDQQYTLDTSNISIDPMFKDTATMDLSLMPGSPCIDRGDPALFDKDGTRSDIGAIHFFQGNIVEFDFNTSNYCEPAYFQFINKSVFNGYTGPVSYEWHINSQYANKSFDFDTTLNLGFYNVGLFAYDSANNLIGQFHRNFDVYKCGGEYINFYFQQHGYCSGDTVSFHNTSSFSHYYGEVTYFWKVNETEYQGFEFPSQPFPAGYFNVNLQAFDSLGGYLGSYSSNFNVSGSLGHFKTSMGNSVCPNEPIIFSYNSNYRNLSWDMGDGTQFIDRNSFEYKYPSEGVYTVTLILNDDCGADTIHQNITVSSNAVPEIRAFTEKGNMFCPYDEITFKVEGKYTNVTWLFDGGTALNGHKVLHAFANTGKYKVIAEGTNLCGNIGYDTLYVEIIENLEVFADFSYYSEGQSYCPFTPIRFHSNSKGTMLWDFGDGATSNETGPVHAYAGEGTYEVKLIVYNGCGNSDTTFRHLEIYYTRGGTYTDFKVKSLSQEDHKNNESNNDTLRVCPGEAIEVMPYETSYGKLKYFWDFGDGTVSQNKYEKHTYAASGLKTITLRVENNCKDTAIVIKYVLVDATIMPQTDLRHIPAVVCPGDEVLFFDFESDDKSSRYTYSIDFGDGSAPVLDISKPSDPKINTLASHVYNTLGTYEYLFTATNMCGNTDTAINKVIVSNDPENVPFYYVSNSTINEDNENYETEDWSQDNGGYRHKMVVPVQWSSWTADMGNTFFVYFWYGDFDPEGDTGPPNGMVSFTSEGIVAGDSVVAFVPVKINEFHAVGVAAAWYCDTLNSGDEPDVFGVPMDMDLKPIQSIPIQNNGYTDLRNVVYAGNIMLDMNNEWDGTCKGDFPEGKFNSPIGDGNVYFLDMWFDEGMQNNQYRLSKGQEGGGGESMDISGGTYNVMGDTIHFIPQTMFYDCPVSSMYSFVYQGDSIAFVNIDDTCSQRMTALSGRVYYKMDNKHHYPFKTSGCPGDPVEFTIVGGDSYLWHFGDGNQLATTNRYTYHTYADTGRYNAYVVITNSCNRTDTVHSPVKIAMENIPMAYFHMFPQNPMSGDTVHFEYAGWDPAGTYQCTWYFGDGSPKVNAPVAKHVYKQDGEYDVKLVVKNGCGQNMQSRYIRVMAGYNECEAEARFTFQINTDTVSFTNNSFGNATNLYWNFGDGNNSNTLNPVHIYNGPGIYNVCLTVFDSVNQCQDQQCVNIIIGKVDCFADFIYSTVSSNNTLAITDKSKGATQWTWDFGDGNTSNAADPVHQYAEPGLYKVCLSISNSDQTCFANKCAFIQIGIIDSTACFAEFGYFADSLKVAFSNKSSDNITHWYWNFGDGNISKKQNAVHSYAKAGSYEVCLSVYDSVTDCRKQICKNIKVGAIDCQAMFIYFVDSSNTVAFVDKSTGTISEWLWNFGDGKLSVLQNPKYKYAKPGIYDVVLTTYDAASQCLSETRQRITVGAVQDCFAEFEYFVDGLTVMFTDKSLGKINGRYWAFGNGTFGFNANPVVTYKKAGVKNVCYYVFDSISGCQSQVCKEIEVGQLDCGSDFTYFIDRENKTVDFYNNSKGDVAKWMWDFGNGTISFDTNANIAYSVYGMYDVCLTVSNATSSCVSKICKEIAVKDTSTTICNTQFTFAQKEGSRGVYFTDATLGNVTSWFWDLGDGNFSKASAVDHQYKKDGIYKVCLSTYDAVTGCYAEKCRDVMVKMKADSLEVLDADFTYVPDPTGNTVKFFDASTGDVTGWYWTFGDGAYTKNHQDVVNDYGKPGNYQVCLYVFDATTGNTSRECKIVPVGNTSCSITADFGKFIDPNALKVNFTNQTKGVATQWFWSFGDGTTSTRQNPVHQYSKPGLYLVSLSARDGNGNCSDYAADFIQVGSIDCKADFTYSVDPDKNKVTLKSSSKGSIDKSYWSFGDGSFALGDSVVQIYAKPGMYMVSLSVSTAGGTCADYKSVPIQVGKVDCNAGFTVYVDSASNKAYFTNEALGNATKMLWQFGDGSYSVAENPIYTFKAQGYYTVSLNTYDPVANCMDHTEKLVLIGSKGIDCEADFHFNVDDRTVGFFDKSIGEDLKYFWWFGDGQTDNEANTSNTYMQGGYYQVCLTVYTTAGIQNTRCKFVPVTPPKREDCLAQFIYSVDSATRKVTFTDQSLGKPNKWLWKFGDDAQSTDQNPSHAYDAPGFYKVRLVSGDTTTGCKSSTWDMVNVSMKGQGFVAGFGYEIDSLTFKTGGYPVDFVGVSAGKPARYIWDFGDGNADSTNVSPNHEYQDAGSYEVCLVVEDQVTQQKAQVCETITVGDNNPVIPISIGEIEMQDRLLFENYPNPFTDFTVISYYLPYATHLTLTVYDETGRKVSTLVNTMKTAGEHELTWDANNITKGLYYVHLQTQSGSFKNTDGC